MAKATRLWMAGVIAVTALGVSAPAQAQGFNFGFHFGDQRSDFFSQRAICMTDRQIRDSIAQRGYTNIYLNVPYEKRIQVRATRDGWVYLLDFDFCSDRIKGASQLRRAQ